MALHSTVPGSVWSPSTFDVGQYGRAVAPFGPDGVIYSKPRVIILAMGHVLLGLLAHASTIVPTVHALVTLAVGLRWALRGRLDRVAVVGAYIAGAEVFWRMTEARIIWEYGKYATILVFLAALFVRPRALAIMPLLFFAVLLPSSLLTAFSLDFSEARRQISFNLSGPFALTIAVLLFSRTTLTRAQYQRVFFALILPTISVVSIAFFGIATADSIKFDTESNHLMSGGYGPCQVSTAMSLAAMFALFALLVERRRAVQIFLMLAVLIFVVQSLLTFARTGLYIIAVCSVVAAPHLVKIRRLRSMIMVAPVVILLLLGVVIYPQLDAFTGGQLSARFADTDSSGRDGIAMADLKIWADHPVLGTGPGMAVWERKKYFKKQSAHTEFTRLVAEHGSLGATALGLFVVMGMQAYRRGRGNWNKALVSSLLSWTVLFMLSTAMRMVAPSFLFGLAFVNCHDEPESAR